MKEITIKIPGWAIVTAAIILTVGLTSTFTRASGRFNLPLSWILSPSGVSVDLDNDGTVDNADLLDGLDATAFQEDLTTNDCTAGNYVRAVADDGTVTCEADTDTTYSAGNQLSLDGTTFNVSEGPGSGLDADTLDSIDETSLARKERGACNDIYINAWNTWFTCASDEYIAGVYEVFGGVDSRVKYIRCCDRR